MKASKREASLKTRSRLRAVVDHHVDRPGVDAQQCVKLTGPNSSIGSLLSLPQGRRKQNPSRTAAKTANAWRQVKTKDLYLTLTSPPALCGPLALCFAKSCRVRRKEL